MTRLLALAFALLGVVVAGLAFIGFLALLEMASVVVFGVRPVAAAARWFGGV